MAENFEALPPKAQIWIPQDSFQTPLYTVTFENLVSRLHQVDVKIVPNDPSLYCTGLGHAYEVISPFDTTARLASFGAFEPLKNIFEPKREVPEIQRKEEALARELQLGIARAAIKAAIDAENVNTFQESVEDLIESFRDVQNHVHTTEQLHYTDIIADHNILRPLIYASQRHKTVTASQARTLVTMIDKAVYPKPSRYNQKMDTWRLTRGHSFAERFTTKKADKKPTTPKNIASSGSVPTTSPRRTAKAVFPKAKESKQKNSKETEPVRTPEEMFLHHIRLDSTERSVDEQRAWLREQYLEKGAKFPEHSETKKVDTVKQALYTYLDSYLGARNLHGLAALGVYDYMRGFRGAAIFKRLLTTGNLFAAKLNASPPTEDSFEQIPLPGAECNAKTLLASFRIVRRYLNGAYQTGESTEPDNAKDIADLLEAYIAANEFDYDFVKAPNFDFKPNN